MQMETNSTYMDMFITIIYNSRDQTKFSKSKQQEKLTFYQENAIHYWQWKLLCPLFSFLYCVVLCSFQHTMQPSQSSACVLASSILPYATGSQEGKNSIGLYSVRKMETEIKSPFPPMNVLCILGPQKRDKALFKQGVIKHLSKKCFFFGQTPPGWGQNAL